MLGHSARLVRAAGIDAWIGKAELSGKLVLGVSIARIEHVNEARVRAQMAVGHAIVPGAIDAGPGIIHIHWPARQRLMGKRERPRVNELARG